MVICRNSMFEELQATPELCLKSLPFHTDTGSATKILLTLDGKLSRSSTAVILSFVKVRTGYSCAYTWQADSMQCRIFHTQR